MADSFKDALQDQTRYYFETKDTKMSYPGRFVRFDFKAGSIDLNDENLLSPVPKPTSFRDFYAF